MTENESTERYYLEIMSSVVLLHDAADDGAVLRTFFGPDRLLAATAELERLNRIDQAGLPDSIRPVETPAHFLEQTLPALAKRQRGSALLAEITDIENQAVEQIRSFAEILSRATACRVKLEQQMARSPLSEPLTDENAPEVLADALIAEGLQSAAEALREERWAKYGQPPIGYRTQMEMFKPGPF